MTVTGEPVAFDGFGANAGSDIEQPMMGGGKRRRGKSRKTKRRTKVRGGAKPLNGTMLGGKSRRKKGKKGRKGKKSRSVRK